MKTWTLIAENCGTRALTLTIIFFVVITEFIFLGPGALWAKPVLVSRPYYHIPSDLKKNNPVFAGSRVPLERHDVTERVEEQINYLLMDRRANLMELLERLSIYGPIINSTLSEEKLPNDLLYLSAALSELTATHRTKSGGYGWWNLGSIKAYNQPWSVSNEWDDRRDPVISTRLAAGLFNQIRNKNPKFDWLLSIASFVDGVDKIDQITRKNPGFSFWDIVVPPFSETLIPRILALKIISENRKHFDIEVPGTPPLKFDLIDKLKIDKELPLKTVSQWVGTTPRAVWELNPGIDPSFGALVKSDKRYPNSTFLRVPPGSGKKVRNLLDSDGYMKH